MGKAIKVIRKNNLFFILSVIITGTMATMSCALSHSECFKTLNSFHSKPLTIFFNFITFLGDGSFILFLALIITLLFKKNRKLAFLIVFSYLVSGLLAQLLKAFIMAPRPKVYFTSLESSKYYLDTFANSRVGFKSFPSGHTASAFAAATVIALYIKRNYICILMLLLATLIGYSRIYLAHHFLTDVLGGALIGILTGTLSVMLFKSYKIKFSRKSIFKKRKARVAASEPILVSNK